MTVRPPDLDENGLPIPFQNFKDYRKLEYLLPGAKCTTKKGVILEWLDTRPQPTYDEIEAVTDEEVTVFMETQKEDHFDIPDAFVKLSKATWLQENRIRTLEGKAEITFRQFVRAVKQL